MLQEGAETGGARPVGRYTVNLSAKSLAEPNFLARSEEAIVSGELIGDRLCFEITETSAVAQMDVVQRFMKRLKVHGCWFALDDFGSGMASFSYLSELPVDVLKIDGSLILGSETDPVRWAMVEAIVKVGKVMGLAVVAEFVENDIVARRLRNIGVDYLQGFGIARPADLEQQPFERAVV